MRQFRRFALGFLLIVALSLSALSSIPVAYADAEAYARWAGKRLPTEFEWEHAATASGGAFTALYDVVWQWTASAFGP